MWDCICVIHPSLNAESYYLVIEKNKKFVQDGIPRAHTHSQINSKALDSNRIAHIKKNTVLCSCKIRVFSLSHLYLEIPPFSLAFSCVSFLDGVFLLSHDVLDSLFFLYFF